MSEDFDKSSQKSNAVSNEMRLQRLFCDAVIKVGDVEFPVHKIILCSCTPYFRALFTRWSNPDREVFSIPGLGPDMMQLIIEFAYTGSASVTEENAQELMMAADQLSVMGVVETCSDFISKQLSPKNCIGIFHFTNTCISAELQGKAYRYIIEHFGEVAPCEEFLQLTVQELTEILHRDDLGVRNESTVYEAVIRWIDHIPEEREQHIVVLFQTVRLALTSAEYIRIHVLSNKLVIDNSECLQMTEDAIQTLSYMITSRPPLSGLCNRIACPRLPNAVLLAIGGWSGNNPTNGIEAYDISTNCWTNITNNRERPRAYHGAAFLCGYVYCVGGFDRLEHFNSVRRLNLSTRTWDEVAPMYYRRCYVSVTVLNGCIYALGGYDGHTRLSTAERYRPESNQWHLIAAMNEQRSDASCTTLHGKVYICGGFNGNECLHTAENYNPKTDQWTMIMPMHSRRSGIGVIAYANHVFAVGGFDGSSRLHSVEAYNPQTNTWDSVSSMLTPRSNFGLEVIGDQLYAVGGFNGSTTTCNVEYYDATTDVWTAASEMEIYRSALSCCVIYGLPNIADYVYPRDALPLFHMEEENLQQGDSD
uniref:Kelch-like protein 10 n=1 Tax=Echeneis naucrates TaxID=173247 RepID=A0A665T7J9_ECHNA